MGFVLNLSAVELTAIAKDCYFFGLALSVMARMLIAKSLPVLCALILAVLSGAV
jgi:hypothetical protein